MKFALSLAGALAAAAAIAAPAHADGPWCAYYGGFTSGATASGIGGSCGPNTTYAPPPGRHRHYRGYRY